jgi:hypothetical protein
MSDIATQNAPWRQLRAAAEFPLHNAHLIEPSALFHLERMDCQLVDRRSTKVLTFMDRWLRLASKSNL